MGFIHLHVHSEYSFLDGLMKIKELVAKAKSLNMKAIALTDHNHIGGCYEFFNECRKENIKPILGVETYWTHDTNILSLPNNERKKIAKAKLEELYTKEEIKAMKSEDKKEILKSLEYDNKQYHLLLLAKNDKGFKDIIRLQEKASEKCTYNGRYLVDDEMLKDYVTENIIATTACIGSIISNLVLKNKLEEAEEQLLKWKDIFKDNLYLEMQPLLIEQQINTNKFYIKMHLKHNIPLVATTDVHYANYEDHDDHDKLMCIGMGKMFDDENRMRYENEFWLKSANEMRESFERQTLLIDEDDREEYFEHCRQAINNTLHINNLITDDYVLGSDVPVYPNVDLKENETPESKLRLESYSGLYKYLSKQKKAGNILDRHTYECRLNHELNIINKKGYAPYFLVVKDFIGYCDSHDIPTGPGRGSAAGALTLLCNNITKIIDPIQHNLLFERFLTADRTSPPDNFAI